MKVYARIPLGDVRVREVVAESVRVGPRDLESRVLWALEEDHGERFLQLKVVFARQDGRGLGKDDGLTARLRIVAATSAAKEKRAGDSRPPSSRRRRGR